jgi:two-component system, OmpR family, sensor kinase
MLNSVRVRLTMWYVLVFGLLLGGFSIFVYAAISRAAYSRLDQSLAGSAQLTANLLRSEMEESGGDVTTAAVETQKVLSLGDVHMAVFSGRRLLTSNSSNEHPPNVPEAAFRAAEAGSGPALSTVHDYGGDYGGYGEEGARLAVLRVSAGGTDYFLALAQPLHNTVEDLEALGRIFYLAISGALLVAGVGGLLLARKSLAPVAAMTAQAESIGARNLHERLEVINSRDELGRLATVLNNLLSRLDGSFERLRQFTADASHELRTPLSIIRGEAEVALSQKRDEAEYRESLAIVQDEARRLSRMVDDMLALARADDGRQELKIEEFYLNDLVEDCVKSSQVFALAKAISLTLDPATDITFRGDESLIRRMIVNLLDNAIKYTPSGGHVSVKLTSRDSNVEIAVADTGIGIPADVTARIFERFYRADRARSRSDGGSGLGLSIAKWVAEAHDGTIHLDSKPGAGSTFTVSLPQNEARSVTLQ